MNEFDFTFDDSQWELFADGVQWGSTVNAVELMTMLEGEDEETIEDAFQLLEECAVVLDMTGLPKAAGVGAAAVRLRMEEQFVNNGMDCATLEVNDPLRLYLEELQDVRSDYADVLFGAGQADDEDLMNTMLGTVVQTAGAFVGRGVLLMDLIQEGNLGLWQAIRLAPGKDFRAVCDRCIRFAMAKAVILQAMNNGVGQKMRQALEDYRQVDQRLLSDLGRNPTIEEIAGELHITAEETATISKMLDNIHMMGKIHPAKETEESSEPEEDQAVEDTAYFQMRQRIADMLADLPQEDAKVLTIRFGLDGDLPLSPEETGRKLGMTPDEVIARESKALALLREHETSK